MENRGITPFFQKEIGLTRLYQTYSMFVVYPSGLEPETTPSEGVILSN